MCRFERDGRYQPETQAHCGWRGFAVCAGGVKRGSHCRAVAGRAVGMTMT